MEPLAINVERARREAKELLAAARRGEPDATARLRGDRAPILADAQRAVARGYGYRSWPELVGARRDLATSLRQAARNGDDDRLYALLEAGAPPNGRDPRTGRTALHIAAAADQLDTVSVLVTWVPVELQARDRKGRTALDLARPGSPVAAVLASCTPDPDRRPLGGLERAGCEPERSAVHMAADLGSIASDLSAAVVEARVPGDLLHLDADEAELLAEAGSPVRHFIMPRVGGISTFVAGTTLLGVHLRVARPARRQGHARTLVKHAAAMGEADGCTLMVLAPTAATVPFFQRLGFEPERSRPDHWYYLPGPASLR